MLQLHAPGGGKCCNSADLVGHIILYLFQGCIQLTPAETHQVRKSRMGADGNSILPGNGNGMLHHRGVADMKPASNVG